MSIALFAIIGAHLSLGAWYWAVFALYCWFSTLNALGHLSALGKLGKRVKTLEKEVSRNGNAE